MQTSSTLRSLIIPFLSMEIFLSYYKAPAFAVYNMEFKICKENTWITCITEQSAFLMEEAHLLNTTP